MSNFPAGTDNLPTNHQDNVGEVVTAAIVNNIADATNALESTLRLHGSRHVAGGADPIGIGSPTPLGGGADDGPALNTWLASNAGKSSVLAAGTFLIGTTLSLPANTTLTANASGASSSAPQTTLQKRNAANVSLVSMAAGSQIIGVSIDGNKANNTTVATSNSDVLVNGDRIVVRDCHIKNSGYSAITTNGAFGYGVVDSNLIEDTTDRSIYLQTQNIAWNITNNRVNRPGSDMGTGPGGIIVHGPGVAGTYASQSDACLIDGNFVDFTGVAMTGTAQFLAIECYGLSPRSTVVNNRIYGPASIAAGCAFFGISIDASHRCVVSNNHIYSSTGMISLGLELASSEGCTVSGNQIYGCATPGSQGFARAISMTRPTVTQNASLKDNVIAHNHIEACQYGIYGQEDCRGNLFTGNVIVDCLRGIYLNGTARGNENAADNTITGNVFRVKNLGQATNMPAVSLLTTATECIGIYLVFCKGAAVTNNWFGPDVPVGTNAPLPLSPLGMTAIYLGGSQLIKFSMNNGDGRRPSTAAATAGYMVDLDVNGDQFTVEHNTARNYLTGFNHIAGSTFTGECKYMLNDVGALAYTFRATDTALYEDSSGNLQWHGRSTGTSLVKAA